MMSWSSPDLMKGPPPLLLGVTPVASATAAVVVSADAVSSRTASLDSEDVIDVVLETSEAKER